jgi:Ca2+-binding EF-hand superfamily protein
MTISDLRRRKLEKSYGSIDVDQDGVIDELDVTALSQIWCDTYDLAPRSPAWRKIHGQGQQMFRGMAGSVDADGIRRVTLDDWLNWATKPEFVEFVERDAIPYSMAVFSAADKDEDGKINAAEMMAAQIRGGMSEKETADAFGVLDTDGDGYVTYDEYVAAARDFYLSEDPEARGNYIAGDL